MGNQIVDHLFRHQYGKMIAILTNVFGLSNIQIIEDAVQDAFLKATLSWRQKMPDNPEAWLTQVAKNRMIDLLREVKADQSRLDKIVNGPAVKQINDLFLDHEVEDSQLRMIFVACHPVLAAKEQIAFALKTISGFSIKEIASALLTKEETIKKRLSRARKLIVSKDIKFEFPNPNDVKYRLERVMEVLYLTFNEGFHSANKLKLVRKDLCGEAIRLCSLLLKKEQFRSGSLYALFSLMCFHSSRIDSKTNEHDEIVDLKHQDRSKWYVPLINIGQDAFYKASVFEDISHYHYEAAIALEHLKAKSFDETNWKSILQIYKQLDDIKQSISSDLNKAIVHLQLGYLENAKVLLDTINADDLEQRAYLYYGCYAEYYLQSGAIEEALAYLDQSIDKVSNQLEMTYLIKKRETIKMLC